MDIGAVVERLIQERGQLDPLVFLQEIGVVSRAGLTSWRLGKVSCLQEVLEGEPHWIDGCLRQAARMARTMGLVPRTVDACRMNTHGQPHALQIDAAGDPGREALFTTHYQRPKPVEGGVQMDLFLDTPETMLINDLLQAIVKHDVPTSTDLFKRLEKEHARNGMLEEFRPLLGAITRGKTLVEDPMGGLELLQGEITPCARQSLGRLEDLFLKPFYRIFDHAFVGKAFDPKHPEAHRSWTLERLEDWKSVGECVLLEEDWMQQPVLLFRRAHALFRLRRLDSSRQVWILFFWKFPRQAAQVLEAGGDKDLMRWWHGFTDWTADKEVDYDLFPAWMLLDQPKLAENRAEWSEETDKTIPGRKAFFLLADLLDAEKETPFSPDSMKLRRKLKKAFPELFTLFMQTRRQGPP